MYIIMKKGRKNLVLLILIALLIISTVSFFILRPKDNTQNSASTITINGKKITLELADTPEKQTIGLMNRKFLSEDSGMLFIFPAENFYNFWMKNTLIPLDMIFITSENKIATIYTAQPCKADPCMHYVPTKPVKYVLEVNAGYAQNNKIKEGDEVLINLSN